MTTTGDKAELLPCPFCGSPYQGHFKVPGGAVFHYSVPDEHKPGCPMRRDGTFYSSEQEAIDAWNTRAPSPPSEVVERVEKRIVEAVARGEHFSGTAKDIVRTVQAASGVPEGWKLVPVEPTPEMCIACVLSFGDDPMADVYRAMRAAAPER